LDLSLFGASMYENQLIIIIGFVWQRISHGSDERKDPEDWFDFIIDSERIVGVRRVFCLQVEFEHRK
jgi:hypothetical protein